MKALPANVDVRLYSSPTDEAKALAVTDLSYQSTLPMDDAKHPGYAIYRPDPPVRQTLAASKKPLAVQGLS